MERVSYCPDRVDLGSFPCDMPVYIVPKHHNSVKGHVNGINGASGMVGLLTPYKTCTNAESRTWIHSVLWLDILTTNLGSN